MYAGTSDVADVVTTVEYLSASYPLPDISVWRMLKNDAPAVARFASELTGISDLRRNCPAASGGCALAAAGFIPVVRIVKWAGRGIKAGSRIIGWARRLRRAEATLDASITTLRASEQATVRRLAAMPEFRGRTFSAARHTGEDFVDDLGNSYDAMGDGAKAAFFKPHEFFGSIDRHVNKSGVTTVIDLTGYTAEQVSLVRGYVNSLPVDTQARIIRVGF